MLLLADRFMGGRGSGLATDAVQVESSPPTTETSDPDLVGGHRTDEKAEKATPAEKSITVLPLLALSSGPDDEYFADGLTEEILNSLAQLPELLVTARTSAFHFKNKDTISVQEDIAEKIATAMNVVMDDDKREAMQQAGLRDVEAFIAWQKGLELFEKGHGDADMFPMLHQANTYFEIVQQRAPKFPGAWGYHADVYTHLLLEGTTNQPGGLTDPLHMGRALAQAISDHEALKFAQKGSELAPGEWLSILLVFTQVALGRFEGADDVCLGGQPGTGQSNRGSHG